MIIRLIILLGFFYSLTLVPKNFLNLEYFNLKEINIVKNSKILESELTTLTKKLYNKNSNYINYELLKKFMKKDIRIEDVDIKEAGLGKLEVNVTEKSLSYYALIKNKIYLVDKNLNIFGYMNEKEKDSVPIIVTNDLNEVNNMGNILKSLENTNIFKIISQIYKFDDNDYRIVLTDGVEIKLNSDIETEKYKILDTLYFSLRKSKKIIYIDLRFEDYIIKYVGDEKNDR